MKHRRKTHHNITEAHDGRKYMDPPHELEQVVIKPSEAGYMIIQTMSSNKTKEIEMRQDQKGQKTELIKIRYIVAKYRNDERQSKPLI